MCVCTVSEREFVCETVTILVYLSKCATIIKLFVASCHLSTRVYIIHSSDVLIVFNLRKLRKSYKIICLFWFEYKNQYDAIVEHRNLSAIMNQDNTDYK